MQYAFIVTFPKKRFIVDISTDSDQTKTFQLERIENGFHVNPALLTIIIFYCPSSNRDHFVFNFFVWLMFFFIFGVERHFQQYFSYIMAISFSGGRSRLDSHLFCRGSCLIYVICIYLRIVVSSTISISDDIRVV